MVAASILRFSEHYVLLEFAIRRANADLRAEMEHSEAQRRAGASLKNDVSVPISRIPTFLRQAADASLRIAPSNTTSKAATR
jgi:hypothetical protein